MTWTAKARDLRHDPRCILHTVVTARDGGESEFKLYGRATPVDHRVREACESGWWVDRPEDLADVLAVTIHEATLIDWNLDTSRG